MRTSPVRLALVVLLFVAALAGGLLVLRSSGSERGGGDGREAGTNPATSDVWKVGDAWTINVRQDAGAVSPDATRDIASVPYEFEVVSAPTADADHWQVDVKQEGAEGPFAKGWHLQYVERDGRLVLDRVAIGDERPLEAQLASIVLGPQFPYETEYTAAPKDATVDAEQLIDRTMLPPTDVPGAGSPPSGAAPPAEAPRLDESGAPEVASAK